MTASRCEVKRNHYDSRLCSRHEAKTQQAETLVAKAHTICPCSKATRGNIEVKLLANVKPVSGGA
jgi:organic hydroperoxide reductase OsmC/OhrA